MYNVYQHWDPLKVCIVGRSYNPKFYDYIKNDKVRKVFYRIAEETEEDYQKLINLLESFNVKVLRPEVSDNYHDYLINDSVLAPPMTPRDYSAMIGNNFYINVPDLQEIWNDLRGPDWPQYLEKFVDWPKWIIDECKTSHNVCLTLKDYAYNNVLSEISPHANIIFNRNINSAMTTRVGKDLYFGTWPEDSIVELETKYKNLFPDYRCHIVDTQGHSDGSFCPVIPGLIVSLKDLPTYEKTFPEWEVIYLPGQSWTAVESFLQLKEKNKGKWWVPGQELNDDFTNFVETWMTNWVGYVEETVFDVNMLIIDEKNIICNNYNQKVFDAFSKRGITAHVINFRHRYFWDGGLHCITSDVHREGTMQDYFPERN
jgi:hypothetical protein